MEIKKHHDIHEGEKNHKKGGWIVFLKTSFLGSEKLFPDLESEVVQSLTEFRDFVQRIIVREQRKKEHKQYLNENRICF